MEIITKDTIENLSLGGIDTFINYGIQNSTLLPAWWSESRDKKLRAATIGNDFLSSIVHTIVAKLFTLPVKVIPKNQYIQSAVQLANIYNDILQYSWNQNIELFLDDLITQDKGAFLLIEGNDNISQPLQDGQLPTGFRHINSQYIQLMDNYEYPYKYIGINGNQSIKIHRSRVIRLTQLPIPIGENIHVGLSFSSRAFNVSQLMMSSIQYGLEGLGKIDSDQIIWGTSVTSQSIKQAFKDSRIESTNSGLTSNGNRVYLGLRDPSAKLNVLDLKRLPANFSYKEFLEVTVKMLAIAAGIDEDDIVSTSSAGTTKTATLISDLKSRFKLVAWFTTKIEHEFNQKFLPNNLKIQIGDTSTEINESEAKTYVNIARTDQYLHGMGALTIRAARQNAVVHGFITQQQFVSMELEDGRLENGLPVSTLFLNRNEMVSNMLNIGIKDPNKIDESKVDSYLEKAYKKLSEVEEIATNTTSDNIFQAAKQSRAALLWFIETYEFSEEELLNDTKTDINSTNDTPGNNQDKPANEQIDNEEPDSEDTTDNNTTKKEYNRPTTRRERRIQSDVRKVIRDVWSDKTDTVTATLEDLLDAVDDDDFEVELMQHQKAVEEFLYYMMNNKQDSGTKLSSLYSQFDKLLG